VTLRQRLVAEGLGTAFLLAVVVGSGIMAERLAGGNDAIALLANALATGAGLLAILLAVGPVSGAHLNPAVTVTLAIRRDFPWTETPAYVAVQFAGAVLGVWAAHAMFDVPILELSDKARAGGHLMWAEFVATSGLLGVVLLCSKHRPESTPAAVAAYITAAYWFTASTSFANPAVTMARALTDSFAGIAAADVPGFVLAQALAVGACAGLARILTARAP
jgi:glycerol uptake facilitator-like aquaporin